MKTFLFCLAALCAAVGPAQAASPTDYPTRQVRMVVPFAPGALNDMIARQVSAGLAKALGQAVIVENRPGAGSQLGTASVASATADGHVLLFGAADGLTVLPAIRQGLPYTVPDSFSFLARVGTGPFALVLREGLGIDSFDALVQQAKAEPGRLTHGTPGNGSSTHLGAALIEQGAGIELTQVHYQGMSGAVNDLLAGHIDAALVSPTTIAPHLASGKIKVVALMGPARHPLLPDVPTIDELGRPDLHVIGWWGVLAPAGLPPVVRERLDGALAAVLADASVRADLQSRGVEVAPLQGEAFRDFAVADLQRWKALSQRANISLD